MKNSKNIVTYSSLPAWVALILVTMFSSWGIDPELDAYFKLQIYHWLDIGLSFSVITEDQKLKFASNFPILLSLGCLFQNHGSNDSSVM